MTQHGLELPDSARHWKLAPSDFAFLWDQCRRCFYLKIVHGFGRPRDAMPGIFSVIDSRMGRFYQNRRTDEIAPDLPPGQIVIGQKALQSQPIRHPDRDATCEIRGRFDSIVRFDDDSYAVIDFKTSRINQQNVRKYARQLHAYAYAMENAAPGKFAAGPISRLGLLVFEPDDFCQSQTDAATLTGSMGWLEIERDDAAFMEFIGQVLDVLCQSEPPVAGEKCVFCGYREESRRRGV